MKATSFVTFLSSFFFFLPCYWPFTYAFTVGVERSSKSFKLRRRGADETKNSVSLQSSSSTTASSLETRSTPSSSSSYKKEESLKTETLRDELIELLSHLSASNATQIQLVESIINELEERYKNPLTVDFFRLTALLPCWQLILSTSQLASKRALVSPLQFRLRGLTQEPGTHDDEDPASTFRTTAHWDYSEAADGQFYCSGSFQITVSYEILAHSTRMHQFQCNEQPVLKLAKGSNVPTNVPNIIKCLHQSIPAELFDATMHDAIDTTYVDAKLKIIRYAGKMEGTRNVFVRRQQPEKQ